MTTHPPDEYGEHGALLRRVLRAEADEVEPAPDGLERIRAGIERRSGRRLAGLYGWAPARLRLPGGWSRPALAVGVTVAVLALGVSAPQTIDRITSAGRHGPSGENGGSSATVPSGPGSSGHAGHLPNPSGSGQPAGPTPGQSPTSPLPGRPGVPTCTPSQTPAADSPAGTAPDDARTTPAPCPEPTDPPSSPEPTDPPSAEPTDPATPSADPTTPPASAAPEQTEGT